MHKSWDQYPFHEDNLPKEEPNESEPQSVPSIAPPPPAATDKKEKSVTKDTAKSEVKEGKKEVKGKDGRPTEFDLG
ncbi:MAG: hypothetical protein ABSB40_07675 [Nitrososphaeria archaeon]